ncbi:hypothetical protein FACS189426_14830 [Bacteroidia bacterium]|nr:hypothetical protein FACS189426_14830 [Bacteroidia bacterium]
MKKFLPLLAIFFITQSIDAQKFIFDLDFQTYFDNREYHTGYSPSKTFFGMHFTPSVGLQLNDSAGGVHRLIAGATYIQPFGTGWQDVTMLPTVFYIYLNKGFALNFGTVPYSKMKSRLPAIFRRSSAYYSKPNIQGALFQFQSKIGFVEFLCDWRGLQSAETRENFVLIINGRANYKWFYGGGVVQMNHLANFGAPTPKVGVCDDALVNPFAGVDFSGKTIFSELYFQTGYIFGYQRDRKADQIYTPQGLLVDFAIKWRWLSLKNNFYFGENMFPFYQTYKSALYWGDPMYQLTEKVFNTTDISFVLFKRDFVSAKFSWQFQAVPGHQLGHRQLLTLNFDLEKL